MDLAALGVDKEIIVVDDCSTDRTSAIVVRRAGRAPASHADATAARASAVRAGIELATGDYLIIQDADLEYDPQDYVPMMRAMLDGTGRCRSTAAAILGAAGTRNQSLAAYLGGRSLSLVMLACTGHYLTDTVTALKLFPRTLLPALRARDDRVRNGSRDHREGARARPAHRRGAGALLTRAARRKARRSACATGSSATRTFWRYRRG